MGMSYNKPVTQWSKGEYTNANNKEDDTAVSWSLQCQLSLLLCSGAAAGSRAETDWAHPVRHLAVHSHTTLWVCLFLLCFLPCMVCRS